MNPDGIKIRNATLADLNRIVEFNIALAWESERKALQREVVTKGVEAALRDARKCLFFVAEIGGAVVGQTMVTFEWSDWENGFLWWIQSVFVDAAYRRRGVFRALHEHVRELAIQDQDVRGLRLYVHATNAKAIETYRRLGMPKTEYFICGEELSRDTAGDSARG